MTGRCEHWRSVVRVGDRNILCSAWAARPQDRPPIDWQIYPDASYYLDPQWRDGLLPAQPPWPVVIVDWPDMGVIPTEQLRVLTAGITAQMEVGALVEIACLGGHGRTGTLLAALIASVEGSGATEAILAVRQRYCEHAIETPAQVGLIFEACGERPPSADAIRRSD